MTREAAKATSPGSSRRTSWPRHANPGLGEGPLGQEDAENFHP